MNDGSYDGAGVYQACMDIGLNYFNWSRNQETDGNEQLTRHRAYRGGPPVFVWEASVKTRSRDNSAKESICGLPGMCCVLSRLWFTTAKGLELLGRRSSSCGWHQDDPKTQTAISAALAVFGGGEKESAITKLCRNNRLVGTAWLQRFQVLMLLEGDIGSEWAEQWSTDAMLLAERLE
jgi:hypothetical protein